MPGKWDRISKRLIGENPSHFIQWLLPKAQYQGVPKPKTPTMETKEIEADGLFKKVADRNWLKRRFFVLDNHLFRDSWVYQELVQEGREEGLQALRLTLLEIVQYRFPALTSLAQKTVDAMSDTDALRRLIVMVSISQTEDMARQALLDVDNSKQKS